MNVNEAEIKLKTMLQDAGISPTHLDIQVAWDIFKSFANEPYECLSDDLLFECGIFDFPSKNTFQLDFTRQFFIDYNEKLIHIEQLHCTFEFNAIDELRPFRTNVWSFDVGGKLQFFEKVESLNEFQIPIRNFLPHTLTVFHEGV